jgi:RNA polymerase sigma factor (TIGR02999 family)
MPDSLETLLARWRDGDTAAGEQVITAAYSELRRMAAFHFRNERPGHTLQPTALVHEVFMKLSEGRPIQWQNRAHFYAVFSRNVRLVLVDYARRNNALKRQDSQILVPLAHRSPKSGPQFESLLTVHEILLELEKHDSRAARIVESKVFGGLKDSEIADALEISVATVKRDWSFARAWLLARLRD